MDQQFKFYEFFCGGGMARAGLGPNWDCIFANDIDAKKAISYKLNWGDDVIKVDDVSNVGINELGGVVDLAWASFPCQDLSLAGSGAGLDGKRSGTFWSFWDIVKKLKIDHRAPKIIVLENVCGTLTSHNGKDFSAICSALKGEDYMFGAVVIDAVDFLPQSRARLFFIGIQKDITDFSLLTSEKPNPKWHRKALVSAYKKLDASTKNEWIWWNLPQPTKRNSKLIDIIEEDPQSVSWHSNAETERLLSLMAPLHITKLQNAKDEGLLRIGTVYKRVRQDANGKKGQRAEVRFDNVAGCLRTPSGGSSRQIIIVVDKGTIRSRLLSSRETARLMGLPDDYKLPEKYNDAYHLTGDGVAVPVVSYISQHILEPILSRQQKSQRAA